KGLIKYILYLLNFFVIGIGILKILGQDYKFIPTYSGKIIIFIQNLLQTVGNIKEKLISISMAKRIIDILKVININVHQSYYFLISDSQHDIIKHFGKGSPVGQLGKIIRI